MQAVMVSPVPVSEMQHKRTTNISHFIHFLSFFFEKQSIERIHVCKSCKPWQSLLLDNSDVSWRSQENQEAQPKISRPILAGVILVT
jgi:hypothetical protein